jgi:hypothetical protein
LLVVLLIILAVYGTFSAGAITRRKLKRQAAIDYQNARGSLHLQMLRDAQRQAQNRLTQCERLLDEKQKELNRLRHRKEEELDQALAGHIIFEHLSEAEGIGAALQEQIIQKVFRGRLEDLRFAHSVHGVGEDRQKAINAWVKQYKARWPELRAGGFEGKEEILAEYDGEIEIADEQRKQLDLERNKLASRLRRLGSAVAELESVTEADFVSAIRGTSREASLKVERYRQGLFAEWEPVPEWFKDAMSNEVDNVA